MAYLPSVSFDVARVSSSNYGPTAMPIIRVCLFVIPTHTHTCAVLLPPRVVSSHRVFLQCRRRSTDFLQHTNGRAHACTTRRRCVAVIRLLAPLTLPCSFGSMLLQRPDPLLFVHSLFYSAFIFAIITVACCSHWLLTSGLACSFAAFRILRRANLLSTPHPLHARAEHKE